jgi:hypothetical protein
MSSKNTALLLTALFIFAVSACASAGAQPEGAVSTATFVSPAPSTATQPCQETIIQPTLTTVEPAQVLPGGTILVTAIGGYVQDSCGGINESARSFPLFLDQEPLGNLSCYVNHCETKFDLADTLDSGLHCLSVQKDTCEFEFEVVSK